jgi:hypothetical protein
MTSLGNWKRSGSMINHKHTKRIKRWKKVGNLTEIPCLSLRHFLLSSWHGFLFWSSQLLHVDAVSSNYIITSHTQPFPLSQNHKKNIMVNYKQVPRLYIISYKSPPITFCLNYIRTHPTTSVILFMWVFYQFYNNKYLFRREIH